MSAHDCERCAELVEHYTLAAGRWPMYAHEVYPSTVAEYLDDFTMHGPVDSYPLCPLCDTAAAHYLEENGGVSNYLVAVLRSLELGSPMLCELCVHRAAHYAQENHGTFAYLRALEQYLSSWDTGELGRYLTGDYLAGGV